MLRLPPPKSEVHNDGVLTKQHVDEVIRKLVTSVTDSVVLTRELVQMFGVRPEDEGASR